MFAAALEHPWLTLAIALAFAYAAVGGAVAGYTMAEAREMGPYTAKPWQFRHPVLLGLIWLPAFAVMFMIACVNVFLWEMGWIKDEPSISP